MYKIVKNALILTAITCTAGSCLGFVHEITKEPIAKKEQQAKEEAYRAVFSDMDSMEQMPGFTEGEAAAVLEKNGLGDVRIEEVCLAMDAKDEILGAVMHIVTTGYGGEIGFSMGIQKDKTVNGIEILSISETAGLGMRAVEEEFKGQFSGKRAESFTITKTGASKEDEIDAISGATITSGGVTKGVNAGLCYFESLREGGVFDE